MGNKKSSIIINPEVTHHKGGTQSINSLLSLLKRGNYFSCKILLDNINYGTGFFAKILSPFENNKIIKVLFTCYHVLTKQFLNSHNVINIEFNDQKRNIFLKNKNRLIWLNENLDYTCIEILDEDNIEEFLKIDLEIYEKNYNENLKNEEIILFGFNKDTNDENSKQSCEFGIILSYNKKNELFLSSYNSTPGASGGAVLLKRGYKLIGIHKGGIEVEDKEKHIKCNSIIPLNLIIKDLKSNKNSFYKLEKDKIIEKKIEKNEIKKKDNFLLNTVSEHLGELNDLIKDLHCSIICQECGDIFGKEIELAKFTYAKMMIENNLLTSCEKCGKNNYGIDVPYNLNMKCKNCGNKCFEKSIPFSMLEMILILKGNFKDCEICGKNDFLLISEGKK